MIDSQMLDINNLFIKLNKLSHENKQVAADLNLAVSQILAVPLQAIMEATHVFQERTLSPRQQKELINKIQYLSNESLTIINNLTALSQLALTQTVTKPETEAVIDMDCLKDVQALLIDDDNQRRKVFQEQLQALGLICDDVNVAVGLPTLQQASQNNASYQIIIACGDHFDHHAAYLGRTIKTNPLYQSAMPVLALATNEPFDFEIERAHFSGFNCVLNQTNIQTFGKKLAKAWQSWSAKTTFRQTLPNKHQHILIVEDEPVAQFSAQHQLNELGVSVDIAADGQTALRLLENNHFDLIFMDIGLPDMSGLEVTAEIRKREQGKQQTPIIGLTVYALEEDEQQGLNVGMNDYLVKPLSHDRLQAVLQKWLANQ
jgi:CheY-like chemotaxis protein